MNYKKYKRGYFMPPEKSTDWVNKEYITKAPTWCSVDLRDGNQALIIPMSLDEKVEYFKQLVDYGIIELKQGAALSDRFAATQIDEHGVRGSLDFDLSEKKYAPLVDLFGRE